MDWRRVKLTEHMSEAAGVVGECVVSFDFGTESATYDIRVYESLKGSGTDPFFALGTRREDPQGYHPIGGGTTAEDALQSCLNAAGVYHRRRVKQAE